MTYPHMQMILSAIANLRVNPPRSSRAIVEGASTAGDPLTRPGAPLVLGSPRGGLLLLDLELPQLGTGGHGTPERSWAWPRPNDWLSSHALKSSRERQWVTTSQRVLPSAGRNSSNRTNPGLEETAPARLANRSANASARSAGTSTALMATNAAFSCAFIPLPR